MVNAFTCNIEKQLETENKMPAFYKRYVDDTLSVMPDLNNSHPSIDFTMELENGYNQEWMPVRHEGLQETNAHWATVTLPQPSEQ